MKVMNVKVFLERIMNRARVMKLWELLCVCVCFFCVICLCCTFDVGIYGRRRGKPSGFCDGRLVGQQNSDKVVA